MRKGKVKLEFNLATVVKGNKNLYYKYKRRAKENLYYWIHLLDVEGNVTLRIRRMLRFLMTSSYLP